MYGIIPSHRHQTSTRIYQSLVLLSVSPKTVPLESSIGHIKRPWRAGSLPRIRPSMSKLSAQRLLVCTSTIAAVDVWQRAMRLTFLMQGGHCAQSRDLGHNQIQDCSAESCYAVFEEADRKQESKHTNRDAECKTSISSRCGWQLIDKAYRYVRQEWRITFHG